MILFSGGLNNEKEARDYIKSNNLTKDDVKLVKGKDYINVVVKGDLPWEIESREKNYPTEFYINKLKESGFSKSFIMYLYPDFKWSDEKL